MSSIEREQTATLQALEAVFRIVSSAGNVHLEPVLRSFEDRVAGTFFQEEGLRAVRAELLAFFTHHRDTSLLSA